MILAILGKGLGAVNAALGGKNGQTAPVWGMICGMALSVLPGTNQSPLSSASMPSGHRNMADAGNMTAPRFNPPPPRMG